MALLGGPAIAFDGLRLVLRHPYAFFVHQGELGQGRAISLVGGLAEPVRRFGRIPLHAIAAEVQHGELMLRLGIILHGGLAEPAGRFGLVLRHAPAFKTGIGPGEHLLRRQAIHRHILFELFQNVLRLGIASSRSLAQPTQHLFPVLRGPFPFDVQAAQGEPGFGIALRGGLAQPGKRHLPILRDAFAAEEHPPHLELGNGIARIRRFQEMGERGPQIFGRARPVIKGASPGERIRDVVLDAPGLSLPGGSRFLPEARDELVELPGYEAIAEQDREQAGEAPKQPGAEAAQAFHPYFRLSPD